MELLHFANEFFQYNKRKKKEEALFTFFLSDIVPLTQIKTYDRFQSLWEEMELRMEIKMAILPPSHLKKYFNYTHLHFFCIQNTLTILLKAKSQDVII